MQRTIGLMIYLADCRLDYRTWTATRLTTSSGDIDSRDRDENQMVELYKGLAVLFTLLTDGILCPLTKACLGLSPVSAQA